MENKKNRKEQKRVIIETIESGAQRSPKTVKFSEFDLHLSFTLKLLD